jgi:hypothetical protein
MDSPRSTLLGGVDPESSTDRASTSIDGCVDRAAIILAKSVAYTVNNLTNLRGVKFQKKVLQKLLSLPILHHALPEYVVNNEKLEHA